MQKIKFHDDYNVNGMTFVRNSEWEFVDKHEEFDGEDYYWVYRVDINGVRYNIEDEYVVEYTSPEEPYNKDYTKEGWREKVTRDALVKDGDYVNAWKQTFRINDPVKEGAEQTDYNSEWRKTEKRIRRHFSGGSNNRKTGV